MLTITLYWLAITLFVLALYTMCFMVFVMIKEPQVANNKGYEDILVKHLLTGFLISLIILVLLRLFVM